MAELERAMLFEDIQILTRILEAELERGTDTQLITACAAALQERHKLLAEFDDESYGPGAAEHNRVGIRILRHPAAVEDSAPSFGGVTEHPGVRRAPSRARRAACPV